MAGAVRDVGQQLTSAPIDVAFVGVGENGHLAFNDPPADFEVEDPYIVVKLDEACRQQQVGEGWFADLSKVPTHALSMSVKQILKAREILAVVPDKRKAAAVQACLEGRDRPDDARIDFEAASEGDDLSGPRVVVIAECRSEAAAAEGIESRRSVSEPGNSDIQPMARAPRPIPSLRWWIGGTVVRFHGHQLHRPADAFPSCALPETQYHWTNSDYANIAIAFRVAYSIGQSVFGRLMDRVGTRRGLTLTVIWLFGDFDADFVGARTLQPRNVPLSAGRGRIGELACCNESGLRMVSETRARAGYGSFRQRFVARRCGSAVYCSRDLFSMGMAAGVRSARSFGAFAG